MRRALGGILGSSLFVLVAACSSGDQDAPPAPQGIPGWGKTTAPSDADVQLHDGSEMLPPEVSDVAKVTDVGVDFPTNLCERFSNMKVGAMLLADRASHNEPGNRDGFLRKLRSVSCDGNGTHVATDPATIPDAFDKLKLDWGFNLPACKDVKGPSLGVDYGGTILEYSSTAKTTDGRDIPFTATAGMDLSLCLSPKVTLKADVGFLKLRSFEASLTGQLEAKALLTTAIALDPSVDAKTREDLANKPLSKSTSTTIADRDLSLGSIAIGPVKLPASAHYTAVVACDLSFTAPVEVTVGAKSTASMTAGIKYDGTNISPILDHAMTFETIPPTFKKDGMLRAICTVTPTITLKLFGIATGEISAKAYAGMGTSQTCGGKDVSTNITQRLTSGDVEAGVSASVLAKVDAFGLYKWKKQCTLFDESTSAQWDHAYPTPGGTTAPVCSTAGPFPLPPPSKPNPESCFSGDAAAPGASAGPIPGACTHDVCTAGDRLGQACDECTMKVCATDPYCCDTYWGLSCFDSVAKLCAKKCQ